MARGEMGEGTAGGWAISKFLIEAFESLKPAGHGQRVTLPEMLDRAVRISETAFANEPARRAQLETTFGRVFYAVRLYNQAASVQERVRKYYLDKFAAEHRETLRATHDLARSYEKLDRHEDVVRMLE